MLEIVSGEDLRRLAGTNVDHCVSMFLPTHRAGPDLPQDAMRLRRLLSTARVELIDLGLRPPEVDRLLAPVTDLLGDAPFWAHLEGGLAVFVSPDGMETHLLADAVEELVVVSERFHLKPLIQALADGEMAYILALSQNDVRLLRAGPFEAAEIDLPETSRSLDAALRWDDRERQVHSHAGSTVGRGQVTAVFHGQGAAKDSRDSDLMRFLRAVDEGVTDVIGDASAPLVLAGVDHLVALYRKVSRYRWLVDAGVGGNPEHLSPSQLHARAWPLVERLFDRGRDVARSAFLRGAVSTVDNAADAVAAASGGRVESLFVPIDLQCWGAFDSAGHVVEEHEARQVGDRDLLDAAAIDTLTHGGDVFVGPATSVPGDGPVAAVLRF